MELFAISGLINALTAVSFGVLVLCKNWRNRQNQIFFLMTGSLAIWGIAYWQWLKAIDYDAALLWVRILAVGSVFIPTFFLDWIVQLMRKPKEIRNFVSLAYLAAITVALFANTEYVISGLSQKLSFPFWPDPGILYTIYFWLLYIGVVFYSIHAIYHGYLEEKNPQRRGQLLYILWGAVLGFGGGFTNFLLWYGIPIPPYGTFLVAAFPFLLGFSLIRHGLFNAKSIATEILVFFIGVILFIQLVLSHSLIEYVLRSAFFVLVVFFGVLLIRSVYREVEQRERIEKLAKALESANKQLEAANKGQENLIHLISHEVKGGLGKAIDVFAEITEGTYDSNYDALKKMAGMALHDNRKVVGQIEDVLNSANFRTGAVSYDKKPFDFREALLESVSKYKPEAEAKGLSFEVRVAAGENYTVNGDRGLIVGHVFKNLIENAINFTPTGSITVQLSKTGNAVLLSVKDTGVGITPEDKERLFTEGGRGKDSLKVNVHSTGYGLFIAKQIVDAHGGRIWAESEGEGKGAMFVVKLPSA